MTKISAFHSPSVRVWELGDVRDGGRSRYLQGKVDPHHYFMCVSVLLASAPPSILCAWSMVWWPLDISGCALVHNSLGTSVSLNFIL